MKAQIKDVAHLSDCIGLPASEAIQQFILSFPQIKEVTFASYSHLPLVQERSNPSQSEKSVIKYALAMREKYHLPFWDCVMLAISNLEVATPTLFDTASTHVSLRRSYKTLDRTSIGKNGIQELIKQNSLNNCETCVTSEVILNDGTSRHLAMMDFHCRPTIPGRHAATSVCKRIFSAGAILLESGESFHAYGLKLLSTMQFHEFLGHALLYTPIVDRAYIAHQLIEQRCALRISGVTKPIPKTLTYIYDE